jgi:hypothetical protein
MRTPLIGTVLRTASLAHRVLLWCGLVMALLVAEGRAQSADQSLTHEQLVAPGSHPRPSRLPNIPMVRTLRLGVRFADGIEIVRLQAEVAAA